MYDNKDEVFRYIEKNESQAIQRAQDVLQYDDKPLNHFSFNGIIGGKNRDYNTNPKKYGTAEEYVAAWLKAHNNKYLKDKPYGKQKSSVRIQYLLEDEYVSSFIKHYLARIYYNKIDNNR